MERGRSELLNYGAESGRASSNQRIHPDPGSAAPNLASRTPSIGPVLSGQFALAMIRRGHEEGTIWPNSGLNPKGEKLSCVPSPGASHASGSTTASSQRKGPPISASKRFASGANSNVP